jgi:hypothetical protein
VGPDFSLRGKESEKKFEKFTFGDHFFDQWRNAFEMGPNRTKTIVKSKLDSLRINA